jgi:hypothetical protein
VESESSSVSSESNSSLSSYESVSWVSSTSEEVLPTPAAYYNCNESTASAALLDLVGSLNFTAYSAPSAVSGKCQGARLLNGGSGGWFSTPSNSVFNPGTDAPLFISLWIKAASLSDNQVIINKENEYQLVMEYNSSLVFRISTEENSGWDKEVRISEMFSTGSWFHVVAWIIPGSEIGLSLNGGESGNTEGLSPGQSAWTGGGELYIAHEPLPSSSSWESQSSIEPPPSSSWESQSSMPPSSSEEEFQARLTEEGLAGLDGVIDEMAIFNEDLTELERAALYNSGDGLFYNGSTWGACGA